MRLQSSQVTQVWLKLSIAPAAEVKDLHTVPNMGKGISVVHLYSPHINEGGDREADINLKRIFTLLKGPGKEETSLHLKNCLITLRKIKEVNFYW